MFLNYIPTAPKSTISSILQRHLAKNPLDLLLNNSNTSEESFAKYQDFFAYEKPLTKEKLNTSLPLFNRTKQLASDKKRSPEHSGSCRSIINTLTIILSFLPETHSETEEPQNKINTENEEPRLTVAPEIVRCIWSFPITCRGAFVSLIQQSDPHALFVLYHFYRAVRILLSGYEGWWAQERARVWEEVLGKWLGMNLL